MKKTKNVIRYKDSDLISFIVRRVWIPIRKTVKVALIAQRLSPPPKLRFWFDAQITSCLPLAPPPSDFLQRLRSLQTFLLPILELNAIVMWRGDTNCRREWGQSLSVSRLLNFLLTFLFFIFHHKVELYMSP